MSRPRTSNWSSTGRIVIRLASWAWLLLLFALAYPMVFVGSTMARDASYWTVHSWKVYATLRDVWALTAQAESSQRSYVLTGAHMYHRSFDHAADELDARLLDLSYKVADNPRQSRAADRVATAVREKMRFLREINEAYDEGGTKSAAQVVRTGIGVQLLQDIKVQIESMIGEETNLLEARFNANNRWIRAVQIAGISIMMIDLSRIAMFWYCYRQERNGAPDTEKCG